MKKQKENPVEARKNERIKTELAVIDFLVDNPNSTSVTIREKLGLKKDHICLVLRDLESAEVVERGVKTQSGFKWRLT